MDLYEILGVDKDAAPHQIKTAYRERAKQTHPDLGNDGAEFADVAKAYSILSNPEMRRRYDETGGVDEQAVHSVHQRMVEILAAIFEGILKTSVDVGVPLKTVDYVEQMRSNVQQNLQRTEGIVIGLKQAIVHREAVMKRITRKGDGQNLFADVLRSQLNNMKPSLVQNELNLAAMKRLLEELSHYHNEVELMQAMQTMWWGPGAFQQQDQRNSLFPWTGT